MPTFYEFFAGSGMARAGLGPEWTCLFANDFDVKKAASYRANWGADHLWVGDVAQVQLDQLRGRADLAWASFPCQDLSLAGAGAGLIGARSCSFWGFWRHIKALVDAQRAPATIVLENVPGTITSHGGRDFSAIVSALVEGGYRCGAVVVNAVHFLPQSRPRLFIVGVRADLEIPSGLSSVGPSDAWHPQTLRKAQGQLSEVDRARWIWWTLPTPPKRNIGLSDLIDDAPSDVSWHSLAETQRLLGMMSDTNLAKIMDAKRCGKRRVGTLYKRTRTDGPHGAKVQRAEVRFDDVAGCLRTPGGGSSRQTLILVEGSAVRSRLLSPREAARLMGLSDNYALPCKYNEAYRLAGDGVAVPVVRFLAAHLLEPVIAGAGKTAKTAA